MKTKWIVLNFLVILAMLLAACGQQHPGSKDVLYVNLVTCAAMESSAAST